MRLRIFTLALAAVSLVAAAPALGHSIQVTSSEESGPGTLGHAILMAGVGDTIEVPAGEYPLTEGETLQAQHNVIRGAGVDETTIVPTGGGDAVSDLNVVNAKIAEPENPSAADDGGESKIETHAQIVALGVTLALFLLVLELVRRRRLAERYALLWLGAAIALLVLAIWTEGLDVLADAMGIQEPANAIFILALGVTFFLLLHFSVATSRLAEETKILAQETARLEQELRVARGEIPGTNGSSGRSDQPQHERPVGTQDGA